MEDGRVFIFSSCKIDILEQKAFHGIWNIHLQQNISKAPMRLRSAFINVHVSAPQYMVNTKILTSFILVLRDTYITISP